jgi:hypothetical protein
MLDPGRETVHEAYAFVCLRCGHGWEQEYTIEHHIDPRGYPFVVYYDAEGRRVPSPLGRTACPSCGGDRLRMMRAGLVAAAKRARGWGLPVPSP